MDERNWATGGRSDLPPSNSPVTSIAAHRNPGPSPPRHVWISIGPMPHPMPRVRPQMRLILPLIPAGLFITRLGKFEPSSCTSVTPREMKKQEVAGSPKEKTALFHPCVAVEAPACRTTLPMARKAPTPWADLQRRLEPRCSRGFPQPGGGRDPASMSEISFFFSHSFIILSGPLHPLPGTPGGSKAVCTTYRLNRPVACGRRAG